MFTVIGLDLQKLKKQKQTDCLLQYCYYYFITLTAKSMIIIYCSNTTLICFTGAVCYRLNLRN